LSSINLAVLVQEFGLLFINLLGHLVDFPFERTTNTRNPRYEDATKRKQIFQERKKERKKESSQQKATINRSSMGGKSAKKPKSGDGERGERRMQRTGGDRRRHRCAGKQTLTTTKIAQNGTEKES
jgi:hypothetical protein